jgi:recombination protein RecA
MPAYNLPACSAEHALKAADLLIQGGGFGLVVMDLGDTAPHTARRISLASWFRLRRAVEHTPTILVGLARQSNAKTCASLVIECGRHAATWSGTRSVSRLLRTVEVRAQSTNRRKPCSPVFTARAI